jgi:hypothetical protein
MSDFDGQFESVVCPTLLGEVRRGLTRDLLDHPGLNPPALTIRAACELLDI